MVIDHKDGNGLNNQRSNLRIATYSQNNINCKAYGKSIYNCVSWHQISRTWRSRITVNGKRKNLGSFKTEIEAAIISNIAMRKYYGEFARTNKF